MAWNDGDGQYLGPTYGGYDPYASSSDDSSKVPLYGSASYYQGGSDGTLLPGQSVGYTNAMDNLGLVPNYGNPNTTAASYENGGVNALGSLGSGLSAAGGGSGGSTMGAIGGAVGTAASIYGSASNNTNTGSAVMSGVASGASAGAAFGPWGAVIGGVVGGLIGLFGSKSAKSKQKKAFQQYEQAQVLPYQQQQANYLQKEGLLQKAMSNYGSGYTPGGFQYQNALTGTPGGTKFKTPGNPSLPNFNVAPPNVVPGSGDKSAGIAPNSVSNNGVNLNPQYNGPNNGAGLGTTGLVTPQNGFAPPPVVGQPAAGAYTGHKAQDQQNANDYKQNYIDYIKSQNQQAEVAAMNPYQQFFFGGNANG
jgi:hypothetical protein